MPSSYDILFSDGEGAEFSDFNNAQRAIMAPLWRAFSDLGRNSTGTEGWSDNPTAFLFVLGAGDAQPVPNTSVNLAIKLTDGLLMQRLSNTYDPADANTLAFFVDGPEAGTTFTHSAAHATLDRWDLVVASLARGAGGLENRDFKDATTGALTSVSLSKRRNISLTTQLIAGTPNASPTIPSVPGGTLPLYAVRVPAAYTGIFTQDQIIDYRMPLGLTIVDVSAVDMWRRGSYVETGGTIAIAATGGAFSQLIVPAAGNQILFVPPQLGSSARLLSIGALTNPAGGAGSHKLELFSSGSGYGSGTLIHDFGTALLTAPAGAGSGLYRTTATTEVTNSIQGGVTTPIWSSGASSPLEQANSAVFRRVGVRWTSGTTNDRHAIMRFVFAGTF